MSEEANHPQQQYQKRLERYSSEAAVINKHIHQISNLRLLIFVLVVVGAVVFYRSSDHFLLGINILSGMAVFIAVVLWHNSLHRRYDNLRQKIRINETGLLRMKGEWSNFKDSGEEFIDHEHPYSWDLDIFGINSVFQWISVCHTFCGRKSLAKRLSEPEKECDTIVQKQQALKELGTLLDWRQELEYNGILCETGRDPDKFLRWSEQDNSTFKSSAVVNFFRFFPYFSFVMGSIGFILTETLILFAVMYSMQFVIFGILHAKVIRAIQAFEKNGPLLLAYSRLLHTIDNNTFTSVYLNDMKRNFITNGSQSASTVFRSLSKVLVAAEVRYGPMAHMLANAVFLWDFQCIIKADKLKKEYGKRFRKWIETIGDFEALASLSVIRFENPEWVFPLISAEQLALKGEQLGHPLLHKSIRITNDYPIQSGATVSIITGSNMSGKSTFLRTVGTNLVLAFAGAPVCASVLQCSPVRLYSSMRVNDDLSSKVSTFYAELLRIKKMVGAVRGGETILFLLDELFRGTNSEDRHDGAVAVLEALSNHKSMGIISTHDLQLCNLSQKYDKKFVNYHFKENFSGDSITFDYKLKCGQSNTKNAMFLLKMIGI